MTYESCEVNPPVLADNQAQVLIAEDDIPLAHFLKRGLQTDKYTVELVHDGQRRSMPSGRTAIAFSFWT